MLGAFMPDRPATAAVLVLPGCVGIVHVLKADMDPVAGKVYRFKLYDMLGYYDEAGYEKSDTGLILYKKGQLGWRRDHLPNRFGVAINVVCDLLPQQAFLGGFPLVDAIVRHRDHADGRLNGAHGVPDHDLHALFADVMEDVVVGIGETSERVEAELTGRPVFW